MILILVLILLSSATISCRNQGQFTTHFTQNSEITENVMLSGYIAAPSKHDSIPNDLYRCAGVCVCYNRTTENDVKIFADCSNNAKTHNLTYLNILPAQIFELDLSRNKFRSLHTDLFSSFKSLEKITSQDCALETINEHPCRQSLNLLHLDLSNNKIARLSVKALECLKNLEELLLQDNNLQNLTSDVFAGLSSLKVLKISGNRLAKLHSSTFEHLSALKVLDFSYNKNLGIGNRSSVKLFKPLKSLEVFHMQSIRSNGIYPSGPLLQLPSLKEISLNGERYDTFAPGLSQLRNLTKISITGDCQTRNFTSSYFAGMPFLSSIKIEGCHIEAISPDVFKENKRLENIEILHSRHTPLLLSLRFLCGLQNQTIKSASFVGQRDGGDFRADIILDDTYVECLGKMNHLTSLTLDSNSILSFRPKFILGLPKSLKEMSVNNNYMSARKSVLSYVLHYNGSLPNLTSLHEDNEGEAISDTSPSGLYSSFDIERVGTEKLPGTVKDKKQYETEFENVPKLDNTTHHLKKDFLPPKLRNYSSSYSFNFGADIFHRDLLALQFLNLSSTLLNEWGVHPLRYMPVRVEVVDLSKNRCNSFTLDFFKPNNSLQELHAQENNFGPMFSYDEEGMKLSHLTKLKYLDLSRNYIYSLPWLFFQYQKNLQILRLSSNKLIHLDIQLCHMDSLIHLDLRRNSLRDISERTRDDLDHLAEKFGRVSIDLRENPILCTCQGLEFLTWLRDTRVRILSKDYLECENRHQRYEEMGDIDARIQALTTNCISKMILILSSSFAAAMLIFILLTVWIFTNRWKLLYLRNLSISYFFGYNPASHRRRGENIPSFTFDAFFVYTSSSRDFVLDDALDELESKRGHRLCVDDRDFLPGSFIPCNITSAVRSSRTTVVVVDKTFKPEGWSHYAVEMAQVEAVRAKRDVLHLLLLDSLPEERLPNVYLKAAKDGRVSEMPPSWSDPGVMEVFWDTLSRTIGHCRDGSDGARLPLRLID